MAKSKNHTNHNQNKKAHKNGIKKPLRTKYSTLRGVDQKFLRNQRFAKKKALAPTVQSSRDQLKHSQKEALIKLAMKKFLKSRKLSNKHRDASLKRNALAKKSKEAPKKVEPKKVEGEKKPEDVKKTKKTKKTQILKGSVIDIATKRLNVQFKRKAQKRVLAQKKKASLALRKTFLRKEIINRLKSEKKQKKYEAEVKKLQEAGKPVPTTTKTRAAPKKKVEKQRKNLHWPFFTQASAKQDNEIRKQILKELGEERKAFNLKDKELRKKHKEKKAKKALKKKEKKEKKPVEQPKK